MASDGCWGAAEHGSQRLPLLRLAEDIILSVTGQAPDADPCRATLDWI